MKKQTKAEEKRTTPEKVFSRMPKKTEEIKVSIVVLSWNTKNLLKGCLESLPPFGEVIVVDNGSTDGSLEYLKKLVADTNQPLNIKLIENKENLGFSRGNNSGIKQASGQYILLLNSDTIVTTGAIERLVEYLNKNENTAVSPLLELQSGQPQLDYYMRFPTLWQIFFYHNPLLRPIIMKTPLKNLICQEAKQEPFEVDQLPGAALMASREVWQKVGSLDPDFRFFWEDVDWSWRARKMKVRLLVVPEAKIVHLGGASWKNKLDKNKNALYQQFFASMLLFVKKNYSSNRLKVFKMAIAVNFLLTGKLKLFFNLLRGKFAQGELWK